MVCGEGANRLELSAILVQIYEHEKNLRRSMQQGISTPYNTLFLAKSSAEDLSNSIFGLKSVWRWAEAYCCTCDREFGNDHRDLAWIPA